MRHLLIVATLSLVLDTGCQRDEPAPKPEGRKEAEKDGQEREARPAKKVGQKRETRPAEKGPQVEVPLGQRQEDEWAHLEFDIVAVHPKRKLIEDAPWHADGGDWTFLECRTTRPKPVEFLVGVRSKGKGDQVAWGEATILAADRAAGVRFLDTFGKAFHQAVPPPSNPQALRSWKFGTAILGQDLQRGAQGGFQGSGGWHATKWFPEQEGHSAEVFFNYNLGLKKGEFSEKDADYREDLLGAFAAALRDGPRPDRTPATDKNLTDVGPRIGEGTRICPKARYSLFSPGGKRIVFVPGGGDGPSTVYAVAPNKPAERFELAQVEKSVQGVYCLNADATLLLIRECIPQKLNTYSSDDPERLWWVDRTKMEHKLIKGSWGEQHLSLGEHPVSPDGRYIVVETWRPHSDGKTNYTVLHLHDRELAKTHTIEFPDECLEHVGWINDDKGLRVVFAKGRSWVKDIKQLFHLADPVTGKYAAVDRSPLLSPAANKKPSPDGSLIAEVRGKDNSSSRSKRRNGNEFSPFTRMIGLTSAKAASSG